MNNGLFGFPHSYPLKSLGSIELAGLTQAKWNLPLNIGRLSLVLYRASVTVNCTVFLRMSSSMTPVIVDYESVRANITNGASPGVASDTVGAPIAVPVGSTGSISGIVTLMKAAPGAWSGVNCTSKFAENILNVSAFSIPRFSGEPRMLSLIPTAGSYDAGIATLYAELQP